MSMYLDFNDAPDQLGAHERVNIDDLRAQLLSRLPEVLFYLFPAGQIRGNQFHIGNIRGDKGDSLVFTLEGDKAGLWHDFATGEGGDLIAAWAYYHNLDIKTRFPEVIESIANWLGVVPTKPYAAPIVKRQALDDLGPHTAKWDYLDADGKLIACVYRYDTATGKQFRPWDAIARKMQAPNPRPLYNQPGMRDESTIILVEGEKCADALINIGICATTAMMGANAPIDKTDWSPLKGKHVIIWPDNDDAGRAYAERVAGKLETQGVASIASLTCPNDKPDKWDAADAVNDGINIHDFLAAARQQSASGANGISAFTMRELIEDPSPMPEDIIAPRILTPAGMLVFGGAPKVGKSDFLLSWLVHMAAGEPFLSFTPPKPLKVFYLQAEIQYHYLRERLKQIKLPDAVLRQAQDQLVMTPQLKMILNDEGVSAVGNIITERFPNGLDILVIDPIRNVFDGGEAGASENDNNAMLFFLRQRVEKLRDGIDPDAGIILVHHTKKLNKQQLQDDPFQALSGAGSLRGYYSSGMILHKPDEENALRKLEIELRNGAPLLPKIIDKTDGQWIELNPLNERLVRADMGAKYDAERDRKHDVILSILFDEAAQGRLYTTTQFCEAFENKSGLGSRYTIRERISVLATKGYLKYRRDFADHGFPPVRSRFGYLCVEGMLFGHETAVDEQTGEVLSEGIPVLPTHFKCPHSGLSKEVENPKIWIYPEGENA